MRSRSAGGLGLELARRCRLRNSSKGDPRTSAMAHIAAERLHPSVNLV
jgi:hypothetical protein